MRPDKREFIAWLNEIETTLPVSEWRVFGAPVWPMVRLELYGSHYDVSLWAERVGGSRMALATGAVRAITAWARARTLDRRRNADPAAAADAVFLAISYGSQPTIAGRRYNWLLAPYVDLLAAHGRTSVVWEMSPGGDYNIPRFTPSHFVQPYLFYERIVSLAAGAPGPAGEHLPGFDEFVRRARAVDLPSRYARREALHRDARFVRRVASGLRAWLRRVRPSLGFVADSWLREQAFCLACREEGVTAVDIQHGGQGALHPAYGSWLGQPPGGYATRPSLFWCWDEDSAAAINAWGRGHGEVAFAGGDPWREMWMAGTSGIARGFDADIARRRAAAGGERHILLNLDPIGPVVPDMLEGAIRRSPPGWCFWPRLHPVNQRARLPEAIARMRKLGVRHVDPVYASQLPLHALLKHVDVHVTVAWSTVLLEAADFGVATVACHPRAAELYSTRVDDGMLRVASDSADLLRLIDIQAGARRRPDPHQRPDPHRTMGRLLDAASARDARAAAG